MNVTSLYRITAHLHTDRIEATEPGHVRVCSSLLEKPWCYRGAVPNTPAPDILYGRGYLGLNQLNPHFPTYHIILRSRSMPGSGPVINMGLRNPPPREIGDLFSSEVWWRNRYRDIQARGYKLRSRYHPNWQPSWKVSGKDFFTAEDGLPIIVGILCSAFLVLTS